MNIKGTSNNASFVRNKPKTDNKSHILQARAGNQAAQNNQQS